MIYRFRHRPLRFSLVILGTAILAAMIWQMAEDNSRGLIIDSIIRLPAQYATMLYRTVAVAMLIIAVLGILPIVRGLQGDDRIILGVVGVVVPKPGLIKAEMSLPYDTINRLMVSTTSTRFAKIRFLQIVHARGRLNICDRALGSAEEFDELCRQLDQRVKRARAALYSGYEGRRFG